MTIQFLEIEGKRFVLMDEKQYRHMGGDAIMPEFPPPSDTGNFPALETARILVARRIIAARQKAQWTQAELARRAKMRVETLNRIERGKTSADQSTLVRLERALGKVHIKI